MYELTVTFFLNAFKTRLSILQNPESSNMLNGRPFTATRSTQPPIIVFVVICTLILGTKKLNICCCALIFEIPFVLILLFFKFF